MEHNLSAKGNYDYSHIIAILTKGLKEKYREIEELKQQVSLLEDKVNDLCLIIKNKRAAATTRNRSTQGNSYEMLKE